jgi:diacylglycerol O-acyltransferase / wax synthase
MSGARARRRARRSQRWQPRWLSGEDSGFLALDLPGQPLTILYMIVLAPGPGASALAPTTSLTLDDLRAHLEKRLDYLPALRWRLVPVPAGLHHPAWAEDPAFDAGRHVKRVEIDAPGGPEQLSEAYARLIASQLDRARPLWDLTLFDGLADGRQAIVWRFHHCLMDGLASLTALERFFAADDQLAGIGDTHPFAPIDLPPRGRMLRAGLRARVHLIRRVPALVTRTRHAFKAREELRAAAETPLPKAPQDVPPCSLTAFGPTRKFTMFELDLADIRLIRAVAAVSYTDVALAVVAGALRSILQDRGDLPAGPLIAECPIAFDGESSTDRLWGNRFANIVTSLATDVADPWERLATVSRVTASARQEFDALGHDLWEEWLDAVPPFVSRPAMRGHYKRRRTHQDVVNANVVVTSVRGPGKPWEIGGLVAEEVWGAGPPTNGVGSMMAFISYCGKVFVGVNSVEQSLPDGHGLADAAHRALSELAREASTRRPIEKS